MTCFAVIAGGGTSGHVLPALAIAESLVDEGHEIERLFYFGARRGVETTLVPRTNIPHEFFDVVGLKRELSLGALRNNIVFLPKLIRARKRAIALMRLLNPRVVVSVGGYASLPAVLAARACGVPVVVVSYDRRPGRSSEWAARRAARCAVAYPESTLPRAIWTGAPVRRELRLLDRAVERSEARRRWKVPEASFAIGVIGGSLGSGILNEAVADYVREHRHEGDLVIHHVVGQRFYDEFAEASNGASGTLDYRVVAYEDDMVTMYSAMDLLIGRGGAGTVAEVATVGIPAILVPWSDAADDHQTQNVRWLSDSGGAVLLDEASVGEFLGETIERLEEDSQERTALADVARRLGERNRSSGIAEVIVDVATRRPSS